MKRAIKYAMLVGFLGFVFFSCKKEQQPVAYLGYDYFPNNVGHYVIYQCDSIIVNTLSTNKPPFDTFQYQVKEVIDSIFLNGQGQPTQRIVRYKRTDPAVPWSSIFTPEKVWTGTLLPNMAIRQEDNYDYIKLIFPMSLNASWNGNAMNTLQLPGNYTCTAYNSPATVGGVYFDSALTVVQINNPSYVGNQYYVEQYATGVGLIYKEVIDYSGNFSFTEPAPADSATYGTVLYTETYLSSGNQ